MLDGDDLVFDVAHWRMEVGNAVNFVGGSTAKEVTKKGGGGRDWTINDDGTISAKHHPHLVLGVQVPGMILVNRDSPERCIFEEAAKLKAGGKASLTLKSHPGQGIGKKYLDERWAGPWRYIESGCGPAEFAVSVKYEGESRVKREKQTLKARKLETDRDIIRTRPSLRSSPRALGSAIQ